MSSSCLVLGDINFEQYVYLLLAAHNNSGVTIASLSDLFRENRAIVNSKAIELAAIGFVESCRNYKDRRATALKITKRGLRSLRIIDTALANILLDWCCSFSHENLVATLAAFDATFISDDSQEIYYSPIIPISFYCLIHNVKRLINTADKQASMTSLVACVLLLLDNAVRNFKSDSLAEILAIKQTDVRQIVFWLVERNLVVDDVSGDTGFALTEVGRNRVDEFLCAFATVSSEINASLSDAQRDAMSNLLALITIGKIALYWASPIGQRF